MPSVGTGRGQLAQPEQCARLGPLGSCSITALPHIAKNTHLGYRVDVVNRLVPGIGAHRLEKLTPECAEQLQAKSCSYTIRALAASVTRRAAASASAAAAAALSPSAACALPSSASTRSS
jgi:hypothetical protein